ncbi:TPA: hypothetical protein ACPYVZ_001740 [Citrobacter sedlakii]|uniref:hypothetical protein n=1 Tax=Citrobacter sedlakii TaxID=67826 RepID=UPI00331469F5
MKLYEMEGFLRGNGVPGDMKVNETNAEYLVRKFSEADSEITHLKKKLSVINSLMDAAEQANKLAQEATGKLVQERNALASENAGLNKFITQSCYVFDGEQHEISDAYICATDGGIPETPSTDAFLAEVRAQGVEMFAAVLRRKGDDAFFDAIAEAQANAADQFAAQLRKRGAQ